MKPLAELRYSILDLVPILEGGTAAEALGRSLELAQRVETWGYHRYWVAEHHNMPGIASAATSVVIGHIAAGTRRMRVGSGGIMLPNHAPLAIAEQFGTLESLFPGRIDLGLGRAPGSDQVTARALRRGLGSGGDTFPRDVRELQGYFAPATDGQAVRAVPGQGLQVPLYLLGSSTFSAQLAAALGLPFAFAAHFAPDALHDAFALYRGHFQPSESLREPYTILGLQVFAAESDARARYLFTSMQQQFLNLVRGTPGQLPPPVATMDDLWSPSERAHVGHMTRYAVVGGPETVRHGLESIVEQTGADEIIATAHIHDHGERLRSFELLAGVMRAAVGMTG